MRNFAEQNINAAQDKTQDDQNPKGIGSEDSPPNENDFFDDMTNAGQALAGLLAGGAAVVTGLFGGSPTTSTGGSATPVPSANETVVLERDRRREEEENRDNEDTDNTFVTDLGEIPELNQTPAVGVTPSPEASGTGQTSNESNQGEGSVKRGGIEDKVIKLQSDFIEKLNTAKTLGDVNFVIDSLVSDINSLPLKERLQAIAVINAMNIDLPLKSYFGNNDLKVTVPVFDKPSTYQLNESYGAQTLKENLPGIIKTSVEQIPKPDPQKILKQLGELDSGYAKDKETLKAKDAEYEKLKIQLTGLTITKDGVTKPLIQVNSSDTTIQKDIDRLNALEAEIKKLQGQISNSESYELKKYDEVYKQKERLAVAASIATDPMIKSLFSADMRKSALELDAVTKEHKLMKDKLLHQDPSTISKEDKDAFHKLTERMNNLEKAFDNRYGATLDSIIANGDGSLQNVTAELKGIVADPKQLITTIPPVYFNKELPITVNPATGQFVIGTPRDAEYFKNLAAKDAYQSKYSAEAFATAFGIVSDTNSPSDPGFIRDRWCVAFSNWSLLKGNLGDAVPDFDQFVKDCVKNNLIDKVDMTVMTESVVNYYSHGLGKFERTELTLAKNDTNVDLRMERERVYQQLGDEILKHNPQVITLRVKEDINSKGHTISLHRNQPDANGKITYTVVDTGNSKMNGSIFDPKNPIESKLGMSDIQNDYSNYLPRRFDYIE